MQVGRSKCDARFWGLAGCLALSLNATARAETQVRLTPQPDPPQTGDNELDIEVRDDAPAPASLKSAPIERVELALSMPAMGAMPRMESRAQITAAKAGADADHAAHYRASFGLAMGGTWELELRIQRAGAEARLFRYSLTTGIPGVADKNGGAAAKGSTAGAMDIGVERLQKINVRFVAAATAPLRKTIRAVGIVEQDKTHREEIALRVAGYLEKQLRGRVGDQVRAGDALFTVYSPELVAAQAEYLLSQGFRDGAHAIHDSAAERLRNLGLTDSDVRGIKKAGKPLRAVTIRAPIAGTILDISAREGAAIEAGQVLYVLGDLSKSYLVARVFQQDIGDLHVGQTVDVLLPGEPTALHGVVDLIYPHVEPGSGTGNVRVEVEAASATTRGLTPGTYADLRFPVELGRRLVVPTEAILYSGLHTYVFVDRGGGVLAPTEVALGKRAEGAVEVRAGLAAGDRVAASGTFLLSSEAQLRAALPKWLPAGASPSAPLSPSPAAAGAPR